MDQAPLILVVDDEPDLRGLVAINMRRAGLRVVEAADGVAGVDAFVEHGPDLVILDVSMPKLDGWGVLERIRDISAVPVIMLTARTSEIDVVRGLRSGAVDYLSKPVRNMELLARVQLHLKRTHVESEVETSYTDDYVAVDFVQRIAHVRGFEVRLTPLEFRMLTAFVQHPDEVLTRDRIRELVWHDDSSTGTDQVKLYVGYLRRKLTDADNGTPAPIETVRGSGYRYRTPGAGDGDGA